MSWLYIRLLFFISYVKYTCTLATCICKTSSIIIIIIIIIEFLVKSYLPVSYSAANTNPLYLDSKRTVGLAAAHGGVSAEGMMSIEYSGPGYDSRDEHDDFSSLPVVDEAAEDQYEPDEWDTTGSLSHHKQSLGDRDGIDESKEED